MINRKYFRGKIIGHNLVFVTTQESTNLLTTLRHMINERILPYLIIFPDNSEKYLDIEILNYIAKKLVKKGLSLDIKTKNS